MKLPVSHLPPKNLKSLTNKIHRKFQKKINNRLIFLLVRADDFSDFQDSKIVWNKIRHFSEIRKNNILFADKMSVSLVFLAFSFGMRVPPKTYKKLTTIL